MHIMGALVFFLGGQDEQSHENAVVAGGFDYMPSEDAALPAGLDSMDSEDALLPGGFDDLPFEELMPGEEKAPNASELFSVKLTRQRVPIHSNEGVSYHKSAYFGEVTVGDPP